MTDDSDHDDFPALVILGAVVLVIVTAAAMVLVQYIIWSN